MNFGRFSYFKHIPTAQASLALGIIGLGLVWSLYFPEVAPIFRPLCAVLGALLLLPVLLKYIFSPNLFIQDLRNPLNGSLMAPMSMALLILCDYIATLNHTVAQFIWFIALSLHLTLMVLFFCFQISSFKITNMVPSWFLYPVGAISGTLAGSQLGHVEFAQNMAMICISIYFVMLPIILYRLVFSGRLPRKARPTLAIMAAPVNLSLTAYLQNFPNPDPILSGALAGIAITMTLLVYLCYINLLTLKFQPSIAAVTFPSVISAVAMERLTSWFASDHPQWVWLHQFGLFELLIATGLVIWVSVGYVRMYWPKQVVINKGAA
ncbi:TDT family transporter [Vibrio sp. Of7-15]|uniref:TDT family transporter n=1 Tax=Vibrio sp. Of7-15 TaxID=2724879 RepID=UPI001EF381E4|nr:TDT family transporter [Vibrio sp. Of7-15]